MGGAADRIALSPPMFVMCSNVESLTVALPPLVRMSEVFRVTGVLSGAEMGLRVTNVNVILPEETRMNCDDGTVSVAGEKRKTI